jgi:putative membrane protein
MSTRLAHFVMLSAAIASVACAKKDTAADSMNVDSSNAAATPTMPATPALTDANIAALLDEANVADSADGQLAATKGTNAEVKAFGKTMASDHHALRKAGLDLATKLSITPEPPAGSTLQSDAKMWHDSLTAMPKGAAWDKAYIDHEVTAHEMVLKTIDAALAATQTPDLKSSGQAEQHAVVVRRIPCIEVSTPG